MLTHNSIYNYACTDVLIGTCIIIYTVTSAVCWDAFSTVLLIASMALGGIFAWVLSVMHCLMCRSIQVSILNSHVYTYIHKLDHFDCEPVLVSAAAYWLGHAMPQARVRVQTGNRIADCPNSCQHSDTHEMTRKTHVSLSVRLHKVKVCKAWFWVITASCCIAREWAEFQYLSGWSKMEHFALVTPPCFTVNPYLGTRMLKHTETEALVLPLISPWGRKTLINTDSDSEYNSIVSHHKQNWYNLLSFWW